MFVNILMTNSKSLLLIAALCLSAVSAYYSIVGLAAIFHSAWISVAVLASILEVCKLILASWLYRNWSSIQVLLRGYLTLAVVVLMLITSMGIFGYLSKAHVEQDVTNQSIQLRLQQLDIQLSQKQQDLERIERDLAQLDRSINIQLDANRAQGALAARRQQQAERDRLRQEREASQNQILAINQQKTSLRQEQNNQLSKLGPLIYVAELFGADGEQSKSAVKWMIVILVFVCDPLAVLMIMAANSKKDIVKPDEGTIRWSDDQDSLAYWNGQSWKPISLVAASQFDSESLINQLQQQFGEQNSRMQSATAQIQKQLGLAVQQEIQQQIQKSISQLAESLASQTRLDQQQLAQTVQLTLEDWLKHTLSVTYSADHAEIQKIVDKAIEQLAQKIDQNQPTPKRLEILDKHQGHDVNSQTT